MTENPQEWSPGRLALYRRYRPETFAEVIGQEHVTEPLRAALANNRVNHAYLFSGPRGCGKTTSARILARTLNCEQAPVADPCGECRSCQDLARGGPGSIDVIEIDAASHGGVDDARDLRERAFFAPVASRYKVYIIDEAHMVSTQGFNALLKLVEEPPEHLRFIFATTEPEKVIPTIRSRTHHYPFRLIPPRVLTDYLAEICEREGVPIEPAALPLVVRAGAGSARDSLSVLDQLIGGAGSAGVTYEIATGLLGYTPDALLDEVVDAFAAGDGGTVFGVVDKVIETGQDPRRFTEDLLRRLRDLVIVAAVPDASATGLIDAPEDQAERLVAQAARFGKADLVRAADVVAAGLTEMRGATTPRLLLELVCARVLLPGADHSVDGVQAKLDRLERRFGMAGGQASTPPPVAPTTPPEATAPAPAPAASRSPASTPASTPAAPAAEVPSEGTAPTGRAAPTPAPSTVDVDADVDAEVRMPTTEPAPIPAPTGPAPTGPAPTGPAAAGPAPTGPEATGPAPAAPSALGLADVRRVWPDILDRVKQLRRFTWILLSQNAQVLGLEGNVLTVGFKSSGARDSFLGGGSDEILRQAAIDAIGSDWRVEAIVDPSAEPGRDTAPRVVRPSVSTEPTDATPDPPAASTRPEPVAAEAPDAAPDGPPDWASDGPVAEAPPEPSGSTAAAHPAPSARERANPESIAAARSKIAPTRSGALPQDTEDLDADVSPDDPDADDSGLDSTELLARELGAVVIDEITHE
ncbi:MAG TPA: DNA polymerase III subunit gamma and tau [Marmoricola sp.]|nr:DNA polymerase III subunit gamma and tau [Marmoricola sp.]